jgi:glycosyltransferase involved in cell wall biosynthesis
MRIAYIAPYQGRELLERRPILRNLALAGNVKIEVISELLNKTAHQVDVISQGEVIEQTLRFYGGFAEARRFHPAVSVQYASTLAVRFLRGPWSTWRTLSLFKRLHRDNPYDVVIIYNLKQPQVVCADYAIRRLGLPVVFEYEDDAFVDLDGRAVRGLRSRFYLSHAKKLIDATSACIGVSPFLLSRVPATIPQMLLRGVVDEQIVLAGKQPIESRPFRVVFSGTHFRSKGLEPLIVAWNHLRPPGWELHIAGRGELTSRLETLAAPNKTIVFHGLLDRVANAQLLSSARIAINPHDISQTPGNVFAFKIIEYLAAGAHCVTTPMGPLEPSLEAGVTYMPTNTPETIASTLKRVIDDRLYDRIATVAAQQTYGPGAVSKALDGLLARVTRSVPEAHMQTTPTRTQRQPKPRRQTEH